jgi:TRAP-type C4-dicarboxylate transport system permease small subunit
MIRVGLLIDLLNARTRRIFEIGALLIGCGFIAFFAWYAVLMTYDSWQFHDRAQGVLPVPLWIPQLGYAGGLVILAIAFVDEFFHVLGGGEPRYEKPKPRTAEEVIEQAIQSGV